MFERIVLHPDQTTVRLTLWSRLVLGKVILD